MYIKIRTLRLGFVILTVGLALASLLILLPNASGAQLREQDSNLPNNANSVSSELQTSSTANTTISSAAWRTFMGPDTVYAFAFEGDIVWWGTSQGVVKWDKTTNTFVRYTTANSELVNNSVSAIAIDANGAKWFGTSEGVSVLSGTTWTTYTTANSGLAGDSVRAIAIDTTGAKWFGTGSGTSVLSGTTWTTYTVANTGGGLVSNSVNAIIQDESGAKWFGTQGGVSVLSGATWMTYTRGIVPRPSELRCAPVPASAL